MPSMIRTRAIAGLVAATWLSGMLVAASPAEARTVWPSSGQAAYVIAAGKTHHDHQHVAPIASMAKVMTAYLVLKTHPLRAGTNGFRMTVTHGDVADRNRRVARGESTVAVQRGEHLTERQGLAALLLPSANNIAIMLARTVSGSVGKFVRLMNRTAGAHHMGHTTYTDPSGFDAHTRSTPTDQLMLARLAMKLAAFRAMVARKSYKMPVVGTIRSTDRLLGTDGFVGIKTGSMDASGGCFMFLSHRRVHGKRVDLYGVVMGQPGFDLVAAGLTAAKHLADSVAPHA